MGTYWIPWRNRAFFGFYRKMRLLDMKVNILLLGLVLSDIAERAISGA